MWPILKDTEKFTDNINLSPPSYKRQSDSSQSEYLNPESPILASHRLSLFNVNLTDNDVGNDVEGCSSQRLVEV